MLGLELREVSSVESGSPSAFLSTQWLDRIPYEPASLFPRTGDDYHQDMEQARLAHLEADARWEEQMRQMKFVHPSVPKGPPAVMTMTENQPQAPPQVYGHLQDNDPARPGSTRTVVKKAPPTTSKGLLSGFTTETTTTSSTTTSPAPLPQPAESPSATSTSKHPAPHPEQEGPVPKHARSKPFQGSCYGSTHHHKGYSSSTCTSIRTRTDSSSTSTTTSITEYRDPNKPKLIEHVHSPEDTDWPKPLHEQMKPIVGPTKLGEVTS